MLLVHTIRGKQTTVGRRHVHIIALGMPTKATRQISVSLDTTGLTRIRLATRDSSASASGDTSQLSALNIGEVGSVGLLVGGF